MHEDRKLALWFGVSILLGILLSVGIVWAYARWLS